MAKRQRSWMAAGAVAVLGVLGGCKSNKTSDDTVIPDSPAYTDPGAGAGSKSTGNAAWKDPAPSGGAAMNAPAPAAARTHTVKKGDTIYSLARQYYNGDMHKWHAIYDANRDQISDPNTLKVGQVLVIPN